MCTLNVPESYRCPRGVNELVRHCRCQVDGAWPTWDRGGRRAGLPETKITTKEEWSVAAAAVAHGRSAQEQNMLLLSDTARVWAVLMWRNAWSSGFGPDAGSRTGYRVVDTRLGIGESRLACVPRGVMSSGCDNGARGISVGGCGSEVRRRRRMRGRYAAGTR